MNWIEVPKNAPEVALATYGRGLWILRDLWQLEQADTVDQSAELRLYNREGFEVFATETGRPFGAVRHIPPGKSEFVLYVENSGEYTIPLNAVRPCTARRSSST